MLGLPLVVGHPVDRLARVGVGELDATLGGGRPVPLREAVPAEPREVHDVDVLDVGALPEVLDEAAERGGFDLDTGLVRNLGGHVPCVAHLCYVRPVSSLPPSVTELEHGGTTYYIVGTAHVSQRSVDEVRDVIKQVEPDVVCVELDKTRMDALTKDSAFRDLDVFKVVREGRTLYLLAHLALASYQRRIGASLGVKPGAELLAAVQEARERGIPVELVDRDINITLKRTWANLGLWKRSMLLSSLLVGWEDDGKGEAVTEKTVEDLKEPKALSEMLTELGRAVPEVKGPLVDERDQYLASKMTDAGAGKQKVVAVVGAAHVPGMTQHIGQYVDRALLDKVPPPSLIWQIVKWGIPALFV